MFVARGIDSTQNLLPILKRAMESLLQLADQHRMARIAVPAISMGVFDYPPEEAVPILVKTTIDALRETKSLQEVRFVVLQEELANLFLQTLRVLTFMSSSN